MRYLIQLEVDSGRDKGQIVEGVLRAEWPVSGESDALMKVERVSIEEMSQEMESTPEEIAEVEKAFEEAAPVKKPVKKAKKK